MPARPDWGLTAGYRYWVGLGTISLPPQQVAIHDQILRRTSFKERAGLAGESFDLQALLDRCVDHISPEVEAEMEAEAAISVAPMLTMQTEFLFEELAA